MAMALSACASAEQEAKKAPAPATEIVSGAARLRGGKMRMDVQVGHAFAKRPTGNGAVTARPTTVVTP